MKLREWISERPGARYYSRRVLPEGALGAGLTNKAFITNIRSLPPSCTASDGVFLQIDARRR